MHEVRRAKSRRSRSRAGSGAVHVYEMWRRTKDILRRGSLCSLFHVMDFGREDVPRGLAESGKGIGWNYGYTVWGFVGVS
jgi:hypothetical protein